MVRVTRSRRRKWMLPSECRTLKVVATVPHGAVLPIWFPAPLDGILASASRNRRLSGRSQESRDADHHVEELPLTAVRGPVDIGAQWVWAASCAQWDDHGTDLRHVHQRWDTRAAETVVDVMPATPEVGRFKQWRIPIVAAVTDTLTWWCVGDQERVADLLDWRVAVGKKRAVGEGEVTRWEVTNEGPPDLDRVLWTPGGAIARPVPARAAASLGVPGCDTIPISAVRPPYFHVAPTGSGPFGRAPRDVIAPWVSREAACSTR